MADVDIVAGSILEDYLHPPATEKGVKVLSRGGTDEGVTTGGSYRCRLEGCTGLRIAVRWKDGHMTYPCSKGMRRSKKHWRIL